MTGHLYGLNGADVYYGDLATAYDVWADDQTDAPVAGQIVRIEEWSTKPLTFDASWIGEWVAERVSDDDGDEILYGHLETAAKLPDVAAAFQAAVDLMLSKVGYRMCDERVATHVVDHDEDGEPLVDGRRLFPKPG